MALDFMCDLCALRIGCEKRCLGQTSCGKMSLSNESNKTLKNYFR